MSEARAGAGRPGRKPKVVVLGGGVGAMTAAFDLSHEGWTDTFDSITVYQVGWRLGGKGSSGRGPGPDFEVQEHGLHVWFGFYENAFRMMRACYAELDRPRGAPLSTFDEAFSPADSFVLQELRPEGWMPWDATFPTNDRAPGIPDDRDDIKLLDCVKEALRLVAALLSSAVPAEHGPPTRSSVRVAGTAGTGGLSTRRGRASVATGIRREVGSAWRRVEPGARRFAHAALGAALELADQIDEEAVEGQGVLAGLVERASAWAKEYLRDNVQASDTARRDWHLADILMACVQGVLRHDVISRGLEVVDRFEFTEWLMLNGADEESARSAFVRTIVYDLPFAYRDGDPTQPSCSAATALGGLARLFFTYKGSIAWKMNAGMGDVVFGPLYEVLRARGVTFEFFHRVDKLHLSADRSRIESIDMTRQLELRENTGGTYDPLIPVPQADATDTGVDRREPALTGSLPCWPAAPKVELLVDGETLAPPFHPLEQSVAGDLAVGSGVAAPPPGRHFRLDVAEDDKVVLGISIGALGHICSELVAENRQWQLMVEHLKTVQTQSFQLWLKKPMSELTGSASQSLTVGGYLEPFDTYADMSQLIPTEGRAGTQSIAYFTNVLPTFKGPVEEATAQVKANALRFLRDEMVPLWPGAVERYPTDFRWELLVVPESQDGTEGVDRLDFQFFKANTDLSDGYVLSLPGTIRYRLPPGDSGFANLFLAGDWTECGINAGCVEAAVISGRLAACKITGRPESTIAGLDFHRPRSEG